MSSTKKIKINWSSKYAKDKLEELIRYVYNQAPLSYPEMKKIYRLTDAPMKYDHVRDKKDISSYIKFYNNYNEDDKYVCEIIPELDEDYYENYLPFIKKIHEYASKTSPMLLKFRNVEMMTLCNVSGMNHDSRGVRDVDWKLHFWKKYDVPCPDGIRFYDFIKGCYKIRSHKFENNYELFTNVADIKVIENGDDKYSLEIFLEFDHGS
ncbi:hypothetical protein [Bandra megavirus]|uniref:Uncharacterized protein n=1 Tax=Bandra megavirus TaxID=2071566 RepID=A0A2K9V6Z4_9VIRU|nr:hypothetical protein [Bandra megavirus]